MLRFVLICAVCSGCVFFGSTAIASNFDYITSLLWSSSYDIKVVGDHAFCSYPRGLMVLDVSDPKAPVFITRLFYEGAGRDITIAGNYAYHADYWAGLRIIDISDPAHPFIASTIITSSRVNGVIVEDGYAYLSDGGSGLLVILDVADPTNPVEIASCESRGYRPPFVKQGDYLYVGGILEGFDIINVSDPADPIVIQHSNWYASEEMYVVGDLLYYNGHTGGCFDDEDPYLRIMDLTDPSAPVQIGEYWDFLYSSGGPLVVIGDYIYVNETDFDLKRHLLVIDVSDPANPVRSTTVPLGYRAQNFTVVNNQLYVTGASSTASISIFDISDPGAPVETGSWGEASGPQGVTRKDNHLYIADSGYGFHVVDVLDPANPLVIASKPFDGNYREIHTSGDYLYLIDYLNGLNVFDISDPARPMFVTTIDRRIYSMDIYGDYLYFTHGSDGLSIYDNSNPIAPVEVSTLAGLGHCYSVDVESNYAYLAVSSDGIMVVDISNPELPVPRGGIDFGNQFIREVEAYGSHLFVPEYNGDLMVIDVNDPDAPELINAIELEYLASTIKRIGHRLFVSTLAPTSSETGLAILDITNPLDPAILADERMPGFCSDIWADDQYLYAISQSLIVMGFTYSDVEDKPALCRADLFDLKIPGTITASADIHFRLNHTADLRVTILDPSGRLQATLFDGIGVPGAHSLHWETGRLSSGIYFLRFVCGGQSVSRSVTVIR